MLNINIATRINIIRINTLKIILIIGYYDKYYY